MAAAICCWQSKKWNRLYNEQRSHWFAASVNHWSRFVFLLHLSLSLSPSLICSVCWSDGLIRAALTCEPSLCCHGTEGYSSNPTTLNTHNICGLHGDKKMWLHMLVDTVFSQPLATLWPHKACWCVRVCVRSLWGTKRLYLFHIWPVVQPIPGGNRWIKASWQCPALGLLQGRCVLILGLHLTSDMWVFLHGFAAKMQS